MIVMRLTAITAFFVALSGIGSAATLAPPPGVVRPVTNSGIPAAPAPTRTSAPTPAPAPASNAVNPTTSVVT
jgi:hypothetical protein